MIIDLIIFLLYFYFCLFSVIGHGLIFQRILFKQINKKNNLDKNFLFTGFYGLMLLTIISFLTSYFLPHNQLHNIILHFFGFSCFLYFSNFKNNTYIKYVLIISFLLLLSIFISKTHDDFSYYHFPFTKYLTEQHIIFGMGHINLGYNLISSLFFLNSTFYLPLINYFSFHFSILYFLIFFNYFLAVNFFIKKNHKFIISLYLIIFIFFNLSFNRIAEFGTDKTGQLLIVLLVVYLLSLIISNTEENKVYKVLLLVPLLGFCITLKTYFIPYIILTLSIFLISKSLKKDLIIVFTSKAFFVFLLILLLNFSHHFISNGCIISPLAKSCFGEKLIWGVNISEIEGLENWLEQWAKAGAGPDFRVEDASIYTKNLNWISNWYEKYFLIKFLDQLLIFLFAFILFFVFFKKLKIKKNNEKKFFLKRNFLIFYILVILIFLVWFFNHPTLRYGGYSAFFLLLSFPLLCFFNYFDDRKFEKNKILYLVIFIAILFNLKNLHRISNELNRDDFYKFQSFPNFVIKEKKYKILKYEDILLNSAHHCWATPSPCGNIGDNIDVIKKGKYFFILKK